MAENIRNYGLGWSRSGYCETYGQLYTWKNAIKACPDGWHLPSKDEWETLFKAVGGIFSAGAALKSTSGWSEWPCNCNGVDIVGFSAFPAGFFNGDDGLDDCRLVGVEAHFWSSTEYIVYSDKHSNINAFAVDLDPLKKEAFLSYASQELGYSVRCLQDDTLAQIAKSSSSFVESSSSFKSDDIGTMTDSRDGRTYKIIDIGMQTWMAQNLNYETDSSYCYNDEENNCSLYGRLYTWGAAVTACPSGWHLPSNEEWDVLFTAVDGLSMAGLMLRDSIGWDSRFNGLDAYGFSALPAGYRISYGDFDGAGFVAYFWSATQHSSDFAYYIYLDCCYDDAILNDDDKLNAFSVRCLRD